LINFYQYFDQVQQTSTPTKPNHEVSADHQVEKAKDKDPIKAGSTATPKPHYVVICKFSHKIEN